MNFNNLIRKLLCTIFIYGLIISTSSLGRTQSELPEISFRCGRYHGQLVTVVRTLHRGNIPLIFWRENDTFLPMNPASRCVEVAARFQRFYNQGTLQFITTGRVHGNPVICVGAYRGSPCLPGPSFVLLTLTHSENPQEVLRQILDVSTGQARARGPITRGPLEGINVQDLIDNGEALDDSLEPVDNNNFNSSF